MSRSPELLGRLDPAASTYLQALRERVLIFDGAMGTNLQLLGLTAEDFGGPELEGCNEILVETRPDLIAQVHRSFYEVGCDVVETDTFGSSSVVLAEYGLAEQRPGDQPQGGAELACAVRDEFSTPGAAALGGRQHGPGHQIPHPGPDPLRRLARRLRGTGARACSRAASTSSSSRPSFDLLSAKSAINGARRAMVALDRIVPLQVAGDHRAHRPHAARHRDRRRPHRARRHAGRRRRPQLRHRARSR